MSYKNAQVKRAADQGDVGLAFNGQGGLGYSRGRQAYHGNSQDTLGNPDRINKGRGPTKAGVTGKSTPNVTARSGRINGGASAHCPTNPDMINAGRGPRKGNQQ